MAIFMAIHNINVITLLNTDKYLDDLFAIPAASYHMSAHLTVVLYINLIINFRNLIPNNQSFIPNINFKIHAHCLDCSLHTFIELAPQC